MEAASPQNLSGDSMGHNGDICVHKTYSEESLEAILIISFLISTVVFYYKERAQYPNAVIWQISHIANK